MAHFKALVGPKLLSNITAEDDFDIREYPEQEDEEGDSSSSTSVEVPVTPSRGDIFAKQNTDINVDAVEMAQGVAEEDTSLEETSLEETTQEGNPGNEDLTEDGEDAYGTIEDSEQQTELPRSVSGVVNAGSFPSIPGEGEYDSESIAGSYSGSIPPSSQSVISDYGARPRGLYAGQECSWRGDQGNMSLVDTDKVLQHKYVGIYVNDFKKSDDVFLAMLRQKYTMLRTRGMEVVFAWRNPRAESNENSHQSFEDADKNNMYSREASSSKDKAPAGNFGEWPTREKDEGKNTQQSGSSAPVGGTAEYYSEGDRRTLQRLWETVTVRMPWYCVPFANSRWSDALCKDFKVTILPVFMIFDDQGKLITLDGRGKLMSDSEHAPWLPGGEKFPLPYRSLSALSSEWGNSHSGPLRLNTLSTLPGSPLLLHSVPHSGPPSSVGSAVGCLTSPRNFALPFGGRHGGLSGETTLTRTQSVGDIISDGESTTCSSMSRPRSPSAGVGGGLPTSGCASARCWGPLDKNVMEGVTIYSRSRKGNNSEGRESSYSRSRSWSQTERLIRRTQDKHPASLSSLAPFPLPSSRSTSTTSIPSEFLSSQHGHAQPSTFEERAPFSSDTSSALMSELNNAPFGGRLFRNNMSGIIHSASCLHGPTGFPHQHGRGTGGVGTLNINGDQTPPLPPLLSPQSKRWFTLNPQVPTRGPQVIPVGTAIGGFDYVSLPMPRVEDED